MNCFPFFYPFVFLLLCVGSVHAEQTISAGTKTLPMDGEAFQLDGHDAFVILPPNAKADIPWVWYAPTLKGLPAQSEVWMFERFLSEGIAIAGIDVGESYGSPDGTELYSKFYDYLLQKRGFGSKPCLLARSRGGLMLYNWAVSHADCVGGIAGIYPVCNIASYPGLKNASNAYRLTAQQLEEELDAHNPIARLEPLAKTKVPIFHIHGDSDKVVPLEANSAELAKRYRGWGGPAEIEVVKGQGHNMWYGWFQSRKLTDFAIRTALGQTVVSVLVVRGGHAYDTPAFEDMCNDLPGVNCDLVLTAHFERMQAKEIDQRYDAILFLNQNKKYRTEDRHRKRYMDLARLGTGMVFLQFTLSSEPEWDEYHDLVGGKWFLKKYETNAALHSTYFTDLTLDIQVLDSEHAATDGISDFKMTDAFYGNILISPDVHPLLGCQHKDISATIAWTHQYKNSKVVYVMPGFTETAYKNRDYRRFLTNSLRFVATASDTQGRD